MRIRKAQETDMPGIDRLLEQVLAVHHQGRPDLFRAGRCRKYTDEQLREILQNEQTRFLLPQETWMRCRAMRSASSASTWMTIS